MPLARKAFDAALERDLQRSDAGNKEDGQQLQQPSNLWDLKIT
jgi:hypothetical protein